jgi:hypothetical protein
MLLDEPDAPVAGAQAHVSAWAGEHLQVSLTRAGETLDRSFDQFTIARLQTFEFFLCGWTKEDSLH